MKDNSARYKCGREIKENDVCYYKDGCYVVKYVSNKLSIIPYMMSGRATKTITGHIADNLDYGSVL